MTYPNAEQQAQIDKLNEGVTWDVFHEDQPEEYWLRQEADGSATFFKIQEHLGISDLMVIHREDGPAIEFADGTKEWFFDGRKLSQDEWSERVGQLAA